MYLYDTWRLPKSRNWFILTTMNISFVVIGFFLMIAGTYGAVVLINDDLSAGDKTKSVPSVSSGNYYGNWVADIDSPFSCADNSNST